MVHYRTQSMQSECSECSVVQCQTASDSLGPPAYSPASEEEIDVFSRYSPKFSFTSPLWRYAFAAGMFLLFCGFVMSYSVTLVHFRMPDPMKYPPLPDIVHDNIPAMDFGALGEIVFILGLPLSLSAGMYYCRHQFFPLWCRFFMAWGYSWIARSVVLMTTQLPPTTDFNCRFNYPNYPHDFPHPIASKLHNTIVGVFSGGSKNVHCGDLMFSGHTVLLCINFMFIITYIWAYNKWIVAFSCLITAMKFCFMVIQRQHYLVDVVVSAFVTISIWRATPERTPAWLNAIASAVCRFPLCPFACWCLPKTIVSWPPGDERKSVV